MKKTLLLFMSMMAMVAVSAQKDFRGIVKYKITVEGKPDVRTDSMMVVFGDHQVKVIMYIPDLKNYWYEEERVFIDNFRNRRSYKLVPETDKFEEDSLRGTPMYSFRNTSRFGSANNRLGFMYEVDPGTLTGQDIRKVECLGSIDFYYNIVKDYAFLGYQPLVVDGRLVLDYSITQANGNKPRVYVSEVIPMENVDTYFNEAGFSSAR